MKDTEIHWDLLLRHLAAFALCIVVAGGLYYYANARYAEVKSSYQQQRRNLDRVARNYRTAIKEEELYQTYVNQYEKFVEQGAIGEEQRLQWIEVLQDINRTLKLPVLKYTIKPQKTLTLSDTDFSQTEKVALYESAMHLTLGLLHAEDLFVFLDELERHANGLFEVRSCEMVRESSVTTLNSKQANVITECLLAWYTVTVEEQEVLE